jgi:predicted GTPase
MKIKKNKKKQFYTHENILLNELIKTNKEVYELLSLFNSYKELIKDETIIKDIQNLNDKYDNYLNISRFSIPIIGLISVGKSTLLNYLLQLRNFLEMGIDKTTSFFCIIRHNKNYQKPVISNIKIEKRHYFKYNFIKN